HPSSSRRRRSLHRRRPAPRPRWSWCPRRRPRRLQGAPGIITCASHTPGRPPDPRRCRRALPRPCQFPPRARPPRRHLAHSGTPMTSSTRSRNRAVVLVLGLAAAIAAGPTARAQSTDAPAPDAAARDEAHRLFEAANLRYELGEYAQAIPLFRRAYELSREPTLLFNLGQSIAWSTIARARSRPTASSCAWLPARRPCA